MITDTDTDLFARTAAQRANRRPWLFLNRNSRLLMDPEHFPDDREELRNHGTLPKQRFRLMRERVEAMRSIWTTAEASYRGDLVEFDSIWSWRKPVQKPHPPVVVGGNGPNVLDRVVEFGDCWIPFALGDVDEVASRVARLGEKAAAAGRGHLPVWGFNVPADAERLRALAEAGFEKFLFTVPSDEPDRAWESVKRLAELAREVELPDWP